LIQWAIDSTIGACGWAGPVGGKGKPALFRFRSPLASLALSVLITLLSVATALADIQPPIPK
jgi:hypothetical protein